MTIGTEATLDALRAIGEDTRFRIVAVLQHGELTVSDLTDILGQSQPRISRHLKLLADAGVVRKMREGTWAFFHLVTHGPIGEIVDTALAVTDDDDPILRADAERLEVVRTQRAAAAQNYFAGVADRWDGERSLHAADETVEAAIADLLGEPERGSMLDVGTGTGRMLQVLGATTRRAVGIDNNHSMLSVARANLERADLGRFELRQGDVYSPPFERDEFDLVVIHQVLHFLDDAGRAVAEAARVLAPAGRLLIVDFAPHDLEFLRTEHAHRRLGFRAEQVNAWLDDCDLDLVEHRQVRPPSGHDEATGLTVSIWVARDRRPALSIVETSVA